MLFIIKYKTKKAPVYFRISQNFESKDRLTSLLCDSAKSEKDARLVEKQHPRYKRPYKLASIIQKHDFGFSVVPTRNDISVSYNYSTTIVPVSSINYH